MSDIDLDAIRQRADAATEGPWDVVPMPHHPGVWDIWGVRPDDELGDGESLVGEVRGYQTDAEFIAHARTDVPALLAEVDRLRGVIGGHEAGAAALIAERDALAAKVAAVEAALANHPECDVSGPYCGWKHAVEDVRAALGGESR